MIRSASILAGALLALSTGLAAAAPAETKEIGGQQVLVDEKGMTLYTFDRDEPNKTNCYNQCAVNWPPLMAGANDTPEGDWTIVERTDGTKMWAYKGDPLYLWINDKNPGDTTGDGVGGVWHIAKP